MPFQPRWGLAWQYFLYFCRVFLPLPSSFREPTVCGWSWPGRHCAPDDWPSWWCTDCCLNQIQMNDTVLYQKSEDVFMPGPHRICCISSEAACYKEDSELNKCELDPEVISVLQQLLLNSPTLCHSIRWHASIHPVLRKLLTFWFHFGSA